MIMQATYARARTVLPQVLRAHGLPQVRVVRQVNSIEGFTMDDLELVGYEPHKSIKMEMAV